MTSSPDLDAVPGAGTARGNGSALAPPADGRQTSSASSLPQRAPGVELIGELPGSGYKQPPALVRRADGQTIQLTRLLYLVLEAIDGHRGYDEIARAVSTVAERSMTGEDVRQLVDTKLRPLGVLLLADGSEPDVKKSNPLLGLRFRYAVSDPEATRRITRPFAALFQPVIVVAVVAAFLGTSGWVLFEKGLASAAHEAFDQPGLLLLVFAITIISAGFHEFGHAAACRYGGATPGVMGAGLYLVWPAFYTEVTDSYRLGRGGRVRVDLGGLYFNAIVAVGMFGVWALTRSDAILLIIAAQVLQMFRQLAPFVRFDGYHILADVTGVPDLYAHIKPTLLGLLPGRWRSTESSALKPWARAVVSAWVLIVVPLLFLLLVLMVLTLPRVAATAWASALKNVQLVGHYAGEGNLAAAAVRVLGVAAIAITMLGIGYLLVRFVRQVTTGVWRATTDHPARRAVAAVVAVAILVGLAVAWWPSGDRYRPIQSYERGTLLDVLPASSQRPLLRERAIGEAETVWASAAKPAPREKPQLALVLIPRSGDGAPWVFPFNKPGAPGGGGNQALAVNTRDGSTVYDVAFAMVWATDGSVLNRNEAYAFASCQRCRTVAVGFQVVLVIGQASLVVPQNISAAVNYSCLQCLTYALAKQLVITLPSGLSTQTVAELEALWREIQDFGATIDDVPIDQIHAQLKEYEAAILAIINEETSATATSSETAAAPEASPSVTADEQAGAGGDAGPTDSATATPEASPEASAEATTSPSPEATSASASP